MLNHESTTLRFDDRMPRWLHVNLCNFLQHAMRSPKDCRGDLSRTTEFLNQVMREDAEGRFVAGASCPPALQWLADHGAHCDCEVILNTVPFE